MSSSPEFEDRYDCDKCRMFGTFCALHRKMELAKSRGAATDPACGYCRRKGAPCSRHGGEPSYQAPKTQRIPAPAQVDPAWNRQVPIAETAPPQKRIGLSSKVDADDREDPEIDALNTVAKVLRRVDASARQRIMVYLNSRYVVDDLVKPSQQIEPQP